MTSTLPSRELLNELKLAKGKNSLIFAITEDQEGLSKLLNSNNIEVRSVDLRDNGNLLQMLIDWENTPDNAVYLIYGISSQFPSVLGYLNLHRDLLFQIKRPVLMAVSEYEIREIQKHAPDLYRYRSRTYDLKSKKDIGIIPIFSEPKYVYYNLPIFEDEIDADTIVERIKLDEYLLGTVNEDYKRVELYMELAISYYKLDDFDKGDDYSRKSMAIRKQQKDDKGIRLNYQRLISVFLLKKQFERVKKLSSLLLKLDPTSASTYAFCGTAYHELGQLEIALKCYEKAVELDPQNASAWFTKGGVLNDLKRYEDALKSSEKAIELDPRNTLAWSFKGAALNNLKRYEEALEAFEKAIELDPNNSHAWLIKGFALNALKRYEDALEAFEKAIELDPKYPDAWHFKGLALNNLGRHEEALEAFEKAIELDPNNSHAWLIKGFALNALKRYEDALEAFEKAIELDPKYPDAWHFKGLALNNLGRHEEALEAFDKAIELDSQNADAWSSKGFALDKRGYSEGAIQAYEKAAELEEKSSTLFIALARLYRKLGREADSIEACKSARDFIESESEYNRACFEAVCGSPDAALKLLRTALEKKEQTADWARRDPDFEPIRDDPRFAALLDEFSAGEKMGPA